jgi:predicted Zn-dependent protease
MKRRRWLWWGILLVLLGGGAALAWPGYASYHLRAGRTALEHYHTAEARRHLDACLRVWPDDETAHVLAARAARRAGDYGAAERHLRACSRPDGKQSPDVVLEWALLTATKGNLLEVEEFLRTRAQKDPAAAPLIWEALAEGNTRMYRLLTALDLLDHWLSVDPDNPRAHYLRGNVHRQASASKAIGDYRRAVELDPDNDEARWWLAVELQEGGQFHEALPHLEQLRNRGWPDRDLRTRIAYSLDRVGRTDEARPLLDTVLADNPDDGYALRIRGQMELTAGNLNEAESRLRDAIRVLPHDYRVRYSLAQCLREEHQESAAREVQAVADKLKARSERLGELRSREMPVKPHDPALHCEMGILLDLMGYTEVAEKWLYSALYEDPDYLPAHAALADFYERHQRGTDKVEEHRRLAQGAKAPDPDARSQKKP